MTASRNKPLKRILLIGMAGLCLLITGCWDRTEINDIAIIIATGVDKEEDGQYRITVQLPLPGQMGTTSGGGGGTGGDLSYYIDSETGRTFAEASENLQARMSRALFSAHRRVLVVGESLAREDGISSIFDLAIRMPENRLTSYLIVAKGQAWELMQAQPKFERFSGEAMRELVHAPGMIRTNLKDIAQAMNTPGSDAIAVYMEVKESQKSLQPSEELEVIGYAQFKNDKMVDYFDRDSASGLMLLRKWEGQRMTFKWRDNYVTVHIQAVHLRIDPQFENGRLKYNVSLRVEGNVIEDLTQVDLRQQANIQDLNEKVAEEIEKAVRNCIQKIVKNRADSVGFGKILSREYPRLWVEQYKEIWPEPLKDAEFTVNVFCEVERIGRTTTNISKKGDGT